VGSDRYAYTVVWLPDEITAQLPLKEFPKLRVKGEANAVPFEAALMPVRGHWYILFSRKALRQMDAKVGDEVYVAFDIADQNAVDIPEVLARELENNKEFSAHWDQQSAGKQRGFAYRITTAKSPETQTKRISEVLDIMAGRRDVRGKLL
jgi:hypothetical protein